jgi:hypothetical protein
MQFTVLPGSESDRTIDKAPQQSRICWEKGIGAHFFVDLNLQGKKA